MQQRQPYFILVDGSSYLYRAFHALPALTNSKGFPTGAIYGMVSMLKKLRAEFQPTHMAVIFDAPGKTFRDDLYSDYKATRKATPDELILQIEPLHQLIRAMGLPLLMLPGVEADDVIGTLAQHASTHHERTLIATSDKDLAQLVSDHIALINTMSNTLLDRQGVIAKFGVPPECIVDYLTLVGDTSDNIPGVPKVGPKTAAKWLQQYGSLAALVEHAADIPGKIGDNLRQFIPNIPLTQSLVTIDCQLNLQWTPDTLTIAAPDNDTLRTLYQQLEFKNWLAELLAERDKTLGTSPTPAVEPITSITTLNKWLAILTQAERFSFALFTTQPQDSQAPLVGIAFATSDQAAYLPLLPHGDGTTLNHQHLLPALQYLFSHSKPLKITAHAKYAIEVLSQLGITIHGFVHDVSLQSYLLDSLASNHQVAALALKYLGSNVATYEEVTGKGAKQVAFNAIAEAEAIHYAIATARAIFALHDHLWPKICQTQALQSLYDTIEMPLAFVLAAMEQVGVLIDPLKLQIQGMELEKKLQTLEQEAFTLAGQSFNLNSPKQLQEILFQQLKLPILQKTPTGQPSTADAVLQELALEFGLPRLIIEYRSISKLISTYTSRLVEQINPRTGRIHTTYHQTATSTGRLSSSDPNLQNIPIRTPEGRRIRQAFIAPPGYKLVSADYSQIELRLMAHLSQDKNLLYAFQHNVDIHQATAAEVWDVPLEAVDASLRRSAKAINFGLIYGMSAFGLSKQLGIERQAAQAYIDRYFTRYPGVREYIDNACRKAKQFGYVETLWGRRLAVPDIHASQIPRQKAAERAAINAPLQGTAADIIKLAMISIQQWLKTESIAATMIMQVHDELVFEVKAEQVDALTVGIKERMANVVQLSVPLVVSAGIGDNWDEASNH